MGEMKVGHADPKAMREIERLRGELRGRPEDVSKLIRLGALLYEPGHSPTEAIEVLERAIGLEPTNTEARMWLGLVFLNEAFRFDDARAVLAEAVAIEPNRADCLDLLAEAVRHEGRPPEEFIGLLERAVESAPEWVLPRVHLALALRDVGRRAEAREHLLLALANDASVPEPPDPVERTYEWEVTGRIGSRKFIEPELKAIEAPDAGPRSA